MIHWCFKTFITCFYVYINILKTTQICGITESRPQSRSVTWVWLTAWAGVVVQQGKSGRLTIVLSGSLISQRWARTSVGSPGWAPGYGLYRLRRADSTRQKMREGGLPLPKITSMQTDLHTDKKTKSRYEQIWLHLDTKSHTVYIIEAIQCTSNCLHLITSFNSNSVWNILDEFTLDTFYLYSVSAVHTAFT